MICHADDQATVLMPAGRSNVRVLRTPIVASYLANPDPDELQRLMSASGQVLLEGRIDLGPMASGQVIGMIHEIKSVRQIIEEVMPIPRRDQIALAPATD
jgi:NAD(P)H-dependent flavin oxidoreductase YrpB (nitropropane dioxygenase family)